MQIIEGNDKLKGNEMKRFKFNLIIFGLKKKNLLNLLKF